MNKKIVFGSIGAVIILFATFTTVIANGTEISTKIKKSPLFNVRTNIAIKKENEEFNNAIFVGKDKNSIIDSILNFINLIKGSGNQINLNKINDQRTERSNCYPSPTCGLGCFISILLLPVCIVFGFVVFCITVLWECFAWPTYNLAQDDLLVNTNNNEMFENLIMNNPEIIPEIMALNN